MEWSNTGDYFRTRLSIFVYSVSRISSLSIPRHGINFIFEIITCMIIIK